MAQTRTLPPNASADRAQFERKASAIELLRDLADILATLADDMDSSQQPSTEWLVIRLRMAQTASAARQQQLADMLKHWAVEDLDQRNQTLPDF
jgi:hypothetical protein